MFNSILIAAGLSFTNMLIALIIIIYAIKKRPEQLINIFLKSMTIRFFLFILSAVAILKFANIDTESFGLGLIVSIFITTLLEVVIINKYHNSLKNEK